MLLAGSGDVEGCTPNFSSGDTQHWLRSVSLP